MQYLNEINSFYSWLTYNSLSTQAQALWFALMHFNNISAIEIMGKYYWPVKFKAIGKKLKSMLEFNHDTQLSRAREELINTGRIIYDKGSSHIAGTYEIIPFDTSLERQTAENLLGNLLSIPLGVPLREALGNSLAYIDLDIELYINNNIYNTSFCGDDGDIYAQARKKSKQQIWPTDVLSKYKSLSIETKSECEDISNQLFDSYMGRSPLPNDTSKVIERICRRTPDFKEIIIDKNRVDLLNYAMEQAASTGNTTWNYIDGVLKRLSMRGIKNIEDCEEYDETRNEMRKEK